MSVVGFVALVYAGLSCAGEQSDRAPITLDTTAMQSCSLNAADLVFDFTSLHIGRSEAKAVPIVIDCPGSSKVEGEFSTVWDGKVLTADTYRFVNGDTVTVQICDRGTNRCYSASTKPIYVDSNYPRDLRLTYTAAVAETIQRKGELRVSYY